jgi:MerR family transcriptional regulator, copper efflux regulator
MSAAINLGAHFKVKGLSGGMKIGELAQASGVTTETIRFYEKLGLLPRSTRAANGYRSYGETMVERVKFIRTAQALGFSLSEIADILPRFDQAVFMRADLEHKLHAKIRAVDSQLRRLESLKSDLLQTLKSLSCDSAQPLTIAAIV